MALVSLVVEVNLPPCAPGLKLQTLQFMCRKQLKPFKRDSLVAFQTTGGVPHVYICLNQSLERVFVISESGPAAEQYAVKFRNSLIEKLRHPSQLGSTFGPFLALADPSAPYRVHNYVARVRIIPESELSNAEGLATFLDLPALKEELAISVWPSTVKILFDPFEYPALVWIEHGSRKNRTSSVDLLLGPKPDTSEEQMKTIIFPSGVIVVHGTDNAEVMIEACQRKLPFLQRFIRTAFLV